MTKQYYLLPDILRVGLLGGLIGFHLYTINHTAPILMFDPISKYYPIEWGNILISGFLVLSGWVNVYAWSKYELTWKDYVGYLKIKLMKILPIYWWSLGFTIILVRLGLMLARTFPKEDLIGWGCSLSATCIYFLRGGGPFMEIGWFVGLILLMYTIHPFLELLMKHMGKLTVILGLIVLSVGMRSVIKSSPSLLYAGAISWHPLVRIFEYVVGMGIGKINRSSKGRISSKSSKGINFIIANWQITNLKFNLATKTI